MHLNTIKPDQGSRTPKKRVGRGIGSGFGKTCGLGHKGQHSRSGGYHKVGFEGGQTPLQRRVPKFGFTSRKALFHAEVRLSELAKVDGDVIDLDILKAAGVVAARMKTAKIVLSGTFDKAVTVRGVRVTKGAKAAIEAAGGKVEALEAEAA